VGEPKEVNVETRGAWGRARRLGEIRAAGGWNGNGNGNPGAGSGAGSGAGASPGAAPAAAASRRKSDEEILALWRSYKEEGGIDLRNRLMEHYFPLVKYSAERLFQKLPQSIELDDLISAGVFGLMDAIDGFDLSRGFKFETYCTTRIRGAILDSLRSFDWVPRLVRTKAHKLEAAMRQLEVNLGRSPTDREAADMLGLSLDQFDALVKEANAVSVVSLSERWPEKDDSSRALRQIDILQDRKSEDAVEVLSRKDVLELAKRELSEKEQAILVLYYFHELTMREIGLVLNLSESRVSQLHSRMMGRLKILFAKAEADIFA